MRRMCTLLLTTCMIFSMLFVASLTVSAENERTVILFEASEQENGEIKIDVNVIENTGVYSMLLTLDYDTSALTLTNVEYGEAFASLEPLASESYTTYPYKISYLGSEEKNDTSTGRMMTLTFAVNENASDGEYTVKFLYKRNKDVNYLKDGEVQTKNLIVNGVKFTLKENVIDEIETVPDNNGGEPSDNNGGEKTDNNGGEPSDNNGVLTGVIVAVSAVGASGIALTVALIVRKKRGKG